WSAENGYPAEHFADAHCGCSGDVFKLAFDESAGVARRTCVACGNEHIMCDGADYIDEVQEWEEPACPCGGESFRVAVGVHLYENSEDVRWLYLGLRCAQCSLVGVYADWKNEFNGYKELLADV